MVLIKKNTKNKLLTSKNLWGEVLKISPLDLEASLNIARIDLWLNQVDNAMSNMDALLSIVDEKDIDPQIYHFSKAMIDIGLRKQCLEFLIKAINKYSHLKLIKSRIFYIEIVSKSSYEFALNVIDSDLVEPISNVEQYLLLKANIHSNTGDYSTALDEFEKIDQNIFQKYAGILKISSAQKNNDHVLKVMSSLESAEVFSELELIKLYEVGGQIDVCYNRIKFLANNHKLDTETLKYYVNFLHRNRMWGALLNHKFPPESEVLTKNLQSEASKLLNLLNGGPFRFNKIDDDFHSSEMVVTEICKTFKGNQIIPNKVKRVALVIGSLGPGGAERQCLNLCRLLIGKVKSKELLEVTLFVTNLSRSDRDRFYLEEAEKSGIKVIEYFDRNVTLPVSVISSNNRAKKILNFMQPKSRQQMILQLYVALAEFCPDVIHAWLDETLLNASLVGGLLGGVKVLGRWGSMPPCIDRNVTPLDEHNAKYLQLAYKSISQLSNVHYSSNSRLTAMAYSEWLSYPKDRISIVYNGLDFSALSPNENKVSQIKKMLNILETDKVVGIICRLSEEKRPFLWLDIARNLRTRNPDTKFIMVGDGPLYNDLINSLSEAERKYIHIVGRQSNVADWYSIFTVFLLTSSVEGLANVVIEAQYMGIPVVSTNVGGMLEAVDDRKSGFLFEFDDTRGLTLAVDSLLGDTSERNRLGENARLFAAAKFSPEQLLKTTLDLYRH